MCNGTGCCNGKSMCVLALIGKILLIVGGVNWGLVGVGMLLSSDWNVIHMILGSLPIIEGVVYLLVGVAAVLKIFGCKCKKCAEMCGSCETGSKTEGSM